METIESIKASQNTLYERIIENNKTVKMIIEPKIDGDIKKVKSLNMEAKNQCEINCLFNKNARKR